MSKQTFHLPTWRRKPTANEAAPDIADSELVPSESAARPTHRKHGKRTYVIGGALLALVLMALTTLLFIFLTGKIYKAKVFYRGASPFGIITKNH